MRDHRAGWLWAWMPPLLWASLIFSMSAVPGDGLPPLPGLQLDKVLHALVFGLLGALCARALRLRTALSLWPAVIVATALAAGYGIGDEIHQMFTPGRNADLADVVADTVGAALGASLFGLVGRARRPSTPSVAAHRPRQDQGDG